MAYTTQSPDASSQILHPSTFEEALVHFLDHHLPLEDGRGMVESFFSSLTDAGASHESVAAVRAMTLPCPPGGKIVDF